MTKAAMLPWLLAVAVLWTLPPAPSRGQAVDSPPRKLVVGTLRVPPFVLHTDDGRWNGLSIELWNKVAEELKIPFEYSEFDYNLAGLLNAVEENHIDVAVAAIPVTPEGEARFDYSHTYLTAGLGIAVRSEPQNRLWATLTGLFSYQLLGAIGTLFVLLLFVGVLVWLAERRDNAKHFDPRPVQGLADGVWWAAVTMTTTGFGDKVPLSTRGRALAVLWMFASIFFIAFFSATLASSFVVGRLKTRVAGPADLPHIRIAAVAGSAGEHWLALNQLPARTYPFVIQATKALQRGDVDALVYEKAILGHMIKEYGWRNLQVLPHTLAVRDYAIALPSDSPIKEAVNRAVLKVVQGPEWKQVVHRYVGATDQIALPDAP